ncbi:MAG: hypothetical protein Q7R83_04270 [bacterium]|nr:hypothetical protein [bacterium]
MKKVPSYSQRAAWVLGAVCVVLTIMLMISIQTSSKPSASNPVTAVQNLFQGADTRFGHVNQEGWDVLISQYRKAVMKGEFTLAVVPVVDKVRLTVSRELGYPEKTLYETSAMFANEFRFVTTTNSDLMMATVDEPRGEVIRKRVFIFNTKSDSGIQITEGQLQSLQIKPGFSDEAKEKRITPAQKTVIRNGKSYLEYSGINIDGKLALKFATPFTAPVCEEEGLGSCGTNADLSATAVSSDLSRVYLMITLSDQTEFDKHELVVNLLNGTIAEIKDWPDHLISLEP